ncbi:MAG TPA: hypothetical protein VGW74_14135 [Propionibacteriaceae bacterium]|nr:hypothetical protein [Propionibacteriaceae bacterium]
MHELRQRVLRIQGAGVSRTLESLPALAGVIRLKTGGAYATDSPSLAMALLAGPSQAGEWAAVVGVSDFGLEAAAAYGLDLDRTVVVPRPGEHWLSVTAGLLEVAGVVVVSPYAAVTDHQAERLRSRLRQKDAALICLGDWPRADATLRITGSTWFGLGQGYGHLVGRRVEVVVSTGGSPRSVSLWLPAPDQTVTVIEEPVVAPMVRAVG